MTPRPSPYDEGIHNGRTDATIENVRRDIADLTRKMDDFTDTCQARCRGLTAWKVTVAMYGVAIAAGFAWLLKLTFSR